MEETKNDRVLQLFTDYMQAIKEQYLKLEEKQQHKILEDLQKLLKKTKKNVPRERVGFW